MRVLLLVGEALFAKTAPAGRIKMALHELFTEIIIMQQSHSAPARAVCISTIRPRGFSLNCLSISLWRHIFIHPRDLSARLNCHISLPYPRNYLLPGNLLTRTGTGLFVIWSSVGHGNRFISGFHPGQLNGLALIQKHMVSQANGKSFPLFVHW
jgi:hypothetical protein